jgi:transcriptional regulator with PAS, ATPase and Fis domain
MVEAAGWVVVVMHRGRSWSVPLLPGGSVRVGRSPDCEVQIDESRVSRLHAVLEASAGDGGALQVCDRGSQNGTAIVAVDTGDSSGTGRANERRLEPNQPEPLTPGTMMHIGSAVLVVTEAGQGAAVASAAPPAGLVVRDPSMARLHELVARVAVSELGVLLLGESGVGKEVLARRIHELSPRTAGPFVAVNCGALAEQLLESELFGHEKGAFTGAARAKQGLFEAASGGTLFLDEVGELSPAFQVKLLRVLEERVVMPVGGTEVRPVDARIVSATNADLEVAVAAGEFRQDLFYRLNGIALEIPPLRDRRSEIEPLARHFLERAAERELRPAPELGSGTVAVLARYSWPGNIRELRNVIERALVLCTAGELLPEHLGLRAATPPPLPGPPRGVPEPDPSGLDLPEVLRGQADEAERQQILDALEACAGNQTRAAERLGITRRMLVRRLEKYNLPRPRR